ncbi:MAG: hypothetical protein AB1403_01600 [Candidatus Riflebacteria bacterium]
MEEFSERVSVIGKSPVILKIWHFSYRQLLSSVLVLLLIAPASWAGPEEEKVSRFQLVSAIYERVYNRQVSELEAINTGLLDAYDDGRFHLEWPVSRGMAAQAFYRLHVQSGTAARLPRAFADIGNDSSFKNMLEIVGGAFMPMKRGNFEANHMLTRRDLFRGLQILVAQGVVKQEDRYGMKIEIINQPVESVPVVASESAPVDENGEPVVENGEIDAIRPALGFEQRSSEREDFKKDAYRRFADASQLVEPEQVNPQSMASVEDAASAMADVEKIMSGLGGSVLEMTSTYPSNPDDENALRKGLAEIEAVLKSIVDRFDYSRLQLSTVMPANPDQIRKCAELDVKLKETIDQAEILRKRIAGRLAEPAKGEDK